jgi:hypothetical protein
MTNDYSRLGGMARGFQPNFVIGLVLADQAKAYYFVDVERAGVVNDALGDVPVSVIVRDGSYHAFIRQVDERVLTFRFNGDQLVDEETGSGWDVNRGLAVTGPLQGEGLRPVPSLSSYDWAWEDFYPSAEFYLP